MPSVSVVNWNIPNSISANTIFSILWTEKYLINPLKKCRIISRIYKNGVLVSDFSYDATRWKIWGSKTHTVPNQSISSQTEYKIEVGWVS